jgi:transposase
MARHFRSYAPEQPFLLPPDPGQWLSEDHLAYCVRDVVQQLDLAPFRSGYSRDGRGAPPYAPQLLVALLLYAWCQQIYSSRQIERLCSDDLGGRYLAAGHHPDHRCISDFRLRHGEALRGLFLQSLRLCQEAGMVSLGHVALDGSKFAANASKHKAMSYGRMVEAEARLAVEIDEMLTRAAQVDAAEDAQFGQAQRGSPLGEELARRQSRLAKLRQAKTALEAEARAAAEAAKERRAAEDAARQAAGQPQKGGRKPKDPEKVRPKDKAQRNFTDPESRIMKGGDGAWVQGYNAQAAVDRDEQVIVACALTAQAADAPHLPAMTAQVAAHTGCQPVALSADPGYFSASNIECLESQGIQALIPPDRERHGSPWEPTEPLPEAVLAGLTVEERQRHRLSTAAGRADYRHRKTTVEPTFGQIKGCPASPGFRGFLRRGLEKCRQEWSWVCAAHNFRKYFHFRRRHSGAASGGAAVPVAQALAPL